MQENHVAMEFARLAILMSAASMAQGMHSTFAWKNSCHEGRGFLSEQRVECQSKGDPVRARGLCKLEKNVIPQLLVG